MVTHAASDAPLTAPLANVAWLHTTSPVAGASAPVVSVARKVIATESPGASARLARSRCGGGPATNGSAGVPGQTVEPATYFVDFGSASVRCRSLIAVAPSLLAVIV